MVSESGEGEEQLVVIWMFSYVFSSLRRRCMQHSAALLMSSITECESLFRELDLGDGMLVCTLEQTFAIGAFRGTGVDQNVVVNCSVGVGADIFHSRGEFIVVHVNQISVPYLVFSSCT